MIQQSLKGRPVSRLAGALLILGLAVSIVLASWVERALALSTGFQYGAFAVWALIIAEAAAVMRLSVMGYRYTVTDGRFFIERVYGDHARIVHDIPLDKVVAVGGKDEIFKRYGNAQTYEKAIMKGSSLPLRALAYRKETDDAPQLLVIQPDEAVFGALRQAARE